MPTTDQLTQWDRDFLWHPFTPMKPWIESKDIVIIQRADREFLIDTLGRRYIDASSSLWCNVHGHNIPELNAAVLDQLNQVAHSTLLGLSNIPSILLAKRLVDLMHARHIPLDKVFYSDNGSTAVEVAAKLAYQYWQNITPVAPPFPAVIPPPVPPPFQAVNRSRFLAFSHAYHGDTLGAVSLGGIPTFHSAFKSLCFPVDFVPPPTFTDNGAASLQAIDQLLSQNPTAYAALIIEPLVLGAGGMLMYPPAVLTQLRQLATRHNTLLIYDEVLTGFGRTGQMFATEHAHQNPERERAPTERQRGDPQNPAAPDLLCLSKGLTAGYMPLGVTLTAQKIFDAFYADPRAGKTFFHGHTFTGHPLACAVALASLDLFEKNDLLPHIQKMSQLMQTLLAPAAHIPHVANFRQLGLIAALDIVSATGEPFPPHYRLGGALCTALRPHGIMLRPLADTVVIMPPLAIREEHLRTLCTVILNSLHTLPQLIAQKQIEFAPARSEYSL